MRWTDGCLAEIGDAYGGIASSQLSDQVANRMAPWQLPRVMWSGVGGWSSPNTSSFGLGPTATWLALGNLMLGYFGGGSQMRLDSMFEQLDGRQKYRPRFWPRGQRRLEGAVSRWRSVQQLMHLLLDFM